MRLLASQYVYNLHFEDPHGHGGGSHGSITSLTYDKSADMVAVRDTRRQFLQLRSDAPVCTGYDHGIAKRAPVRLANALAWEPEHQTRRRGW